MKLLFFDTETFSASNIQKEGAAKYARDPSTECMIITWCLEEGDVVTEDLTRSDMSSDQVHISEALVSKLLDPDYMKVAHNMPFDREILRHTCRIEIPWSQCMDSQALAYSLGFTGGLGAIQKSLGFSEEQAKIKEGRALIKQFCTPQPRSHNVRRWKRFNDPDGWDKFLDYAVRDTESMREMWQILQGLGTMSDYEWEVWRTTQEMNDRGMPVDGMLINRAIDMADHRKHALQKLLSSIVGLPLPISNARMKDWLELNGLKLPNMQAATLDAALEKELPPEVRKALATRRIVTQTAVTKWTKFKEMACADNRVRGQFLYCGASRTGRFASRGINLQNLKRPPKGLMDDHVKLIYRGDNDDLAFFHKEPMDFLAGTVRGAITAPKDSLLVVSDLSSIESRVLAWLTQCKAMMDVFAQGKDTYKAFATYMFRERYDDVTKSQRTLVKPAVLGAGYMMGGQGLAKYAETMGIDLRGDDAQACVDTFRSVYPEIPLFWEWIINAVYKALSFHTPVKGYNLTIATEDDYLMITLPSGRKMAYHQPLWKLWDTPIGQKMSYTYMGINRFTTKWERVSAHAGGITENIVQAIARDIMVDWIMRLRHLEIVGTVHDEIIIVSREATAPALLEQVNNTIAQEIPWAPGLLLSAEGFITKHYQKD